MASVSIVERIAQSPGTLPVYSQVEPRVSEGRLGLEIPLSVPLSFHGCPERVNGFSGARMLTEA